MATGDRLTCAFVDDGLMRKNEAEQDVAVFREDHGIQLILADAGTASSSASRVEDPEGKRKIIGEEFIRVFEEEAGKVEDARFLVQGTLYSDVIESGGAAAPRRRSSRTTTWRAPRGHGDRAR